MSDERDKALDEGMLERLWNSDVELKRAAAAEGMTLSQLATWARKRANKEMAAGLRVWADAATQMMLSRHRVSAVARLLDIAHKEQGETARKACVDAIKLNVIAPEPADDPRRGGMEAIEPYDDDALIAKLRQLGMGTFECVVMADQFVSQTTVRKRLALPGEGQ